MHAQFLIEIFFQSGDAYTLAMAWVGYIPVCMWLKPFQDYLNLILSTVCKELYSPLLCQQQAINIINNLGGLSESSPKLFFLFLYNFSPGIMTRVFFCFLYFIIS